MQLYAILSLIGQFSKQDGFLFVSLTFDCSFPPSFSSSFLRISPLTALSTENRHAVGITTATTLTRRRRCCRRRCCCRPSLSPSCSEKKGSAEHLSLISRNLASDSPSPVRWPRSALAPRGTTTANARACACASCSPPLSSLLSVVEGKSTLRDLESSLFIFFISPSKGKSKVSDLDSLLVVLENVGVCFDCTCCVCAAHS